MSGWVAPSRLGFGWGGWHPYTWVYCGLILFTRQLNLLRLHRLQIAPNARQLILATLTSARSRQGLVGVGGTLTSGRGGWHPHVSSTLTSARSRQHAHVSTLTSARSRQGLVGVGGTLTSAPIKLRGAIEASRVGLCKVWRVQGAAVGPRSDGP